MVALLLTRMTLHNVLHIDYETYSEVDIKKVGGAYYARHPSTEILCLSWAMNDDKVKLFIPGQSDKKFLKALAKADFVAGHNVTFEYSITKHVATRQLGWPEIPQEKLICTAALSSYRGLPRSLDGCAKALGLIEQKDPRGQRLIMKLCKPRNPSQKNPDTRWTPETAPEDFRDFYDYCIQDTKTEREIHRALGELPDYEKQVWQMDFSMNQRGIPVNKKILKRAVKAVEYLTVNLEKKAVEGKPFDSVGQRQKVLDWCEMLGYKLADFTAPTLEEAVNDPHCPRDVKQVLVARQQCSRTSLKKFDAMLRALCDDHTVKGCFIYHGAHTGRWTGSLIQPQNLPRPTITEEEIDKVMGYLHKKQYHKLLKFDDPTGALVSCIRAMIQPEEDSLFFASDYSNVEGRVLFCVAQCLTGIKVFRKNRDLYKEMATRIYDIKYSEVNGEQRRIGKLAILGLGYQMGAPKFRATCASKGVDITIEFSEQVVEAYRALYPEVKELWYSCEQTAKTAIMNPGKVYRVNKYVAYKYTGHTLLCQLPSKRLIHYPFATIKPMKAPWGGTKETIVYKSYDKGQFRDTKTFGGSLVENIIQAICRDLLVHAQFNLEAQDYLTRMTIHDELVLSKQKGSVKQVTQIMVDLPEWAADDEWPIKAESWKGRRFRK